MRAKLALLFSLLLVFAFVALGKEDPELKQCKHQCRHQQRFDEHERKQCEKRCEDYVREKQRRERGEREQEEGGREGGGWILLDEEENPRSPEEVRRKACERRCELSRIEQREECKQACREQHRGRRDVDEGEENPRSPEEKRRECHRRCEAREEQHRPECKQRCEEEFRRQRGGGRDDNPHRDPSEDERTCKDDCGRQFERRDQRESCERRCRRGRNEEEYREGMTEQEEEFGKGREREDENPYVFEDEHFTTQLKTQHGRVRILQKFTERSRLFKGIENFRLEILEAEPQTFVIPKHCDAEAIFFVANGRGTISMSFPEKRESFNIRQGDILRIPAGVSVYMINRDDKEHLCIAKLIQPVSTPGNFESFFEAGGENPESLYKAFSTELLATALNTRRDRLERLFGQQREGVIVKASKEQIRAMSRHEEGGIWPFGQQSKGTFNLFEKRPSVSNEFGRLHEATFEDCRGLEELDVTVVFANQTQGSMSGPVYCSKATKIALVLNGEGYFEMACPHLARGQSRGRQHQGGATISPSYQKVRARLRRGTVFVLPPGHPIITVASNNQNLEVVMFEVKARNNERFPLAGRRNVVNQWEREAKELAFGTDASQVEEVFGSQDEELFFRGPRQQGRADA